MGLNRPIYVPSVLRHVSSSLSRLRTRVPTRHVASELVLSSSSSSSSSFSEPEMEIGWRVAVGVKKQDKRKSKRLSKTLVAYLNSDCYMFAPLFSASPPPSDSAFSSMAIAGLGTMEVEKKGKKRRMLEKVKGYLKSDCHLYGSLASPPKRRNLPKEEVQLASMVTTEVSTSTTVVMEDSQRRLGSSNQKRGEQNPRLRICHHPRREEQGKSVRRSLRQQRQRSQASSLPNKRRIAIE